MKEGEKPPPTVEISKVMSNALVVLKFSKDMQFSDDLPELIANQREDDMLLDLRLIAQGADDEEQQALQLKNWKVKSSSSNHIVLQLEFNSPIEVSSSIKGLDKLLVQVNMDMYEDMDGKRLPPSVLKV